jgi:DNA helicase-2/ATP-dependent DNA helicase PcrA
MEDGVFPHSVSLRDPAGLEEERRLCYVGMTRAMERLTITSAAERLRYGSRSYGLPSRFLAEIPREVTEQIGPRRARGLRRAVESEAPLYDYSYAQADPAEIGIARGMRVRHPNFGTGVVLSVAGSGANQKLEIKFERAGVKKLLLKFANLELG